jgi:hypothetical protein
MARAAPTRDDPKGGVMARASVSILDRGSMFSVQTVVQFLQKQAK